MKDLFKRAIQEFMKRGLTADETLEMLSILSNMAFAKVYGEMMFTFSPADIERLGSLPEAESIAETKRLFQEKTGEDPEARELEALEELIDEILKENEAGNIKKKLEQMSQSS